MANKHNAGISGVREKTHEGVDKIMNKAESLKESGEEAIAHMKESGEEAMHNLNKNAMQIKKKIDVSIRESPEKAVLIAAGIGAVAGATIAAVAMRKKQ